MESTYFQIDNSFQEKKSKVQVQEDIQDILILAPFQPVLKIEFIKVKLGSTSERYLLIRNPLNTIAKVDILKLPQSEFQFSQTEFEINPNSQVSIKISWTPLREGAFKHTFQIKCNRLKIDVGLICECVNLTKKTKKINKESTLKIKSKARYSKFTCQKGSILHKSSNELHKQTTPQRKSLTKTKQSFIKIHSTKPTTPIDRRSTYIISERDKENVIPQLSFTITTESNLNISDHFQSRLNFSSDLINDKAQSPLTHSHSLSPLQMRSFNKTFSPEANSLKSFESPNYNRIKNELFSPNNKILSEAKSNVCQQSEFVDFPREDQTDFSDQPLDLRKKKSPFILEKSTPKRSKARHYPITPKEKHQFPDFNTTEEFKDALFGTICEDDELVKEENEPFIKDSFELKMTSTSIINNKTMESNFESEMTLGTAMTFSPVKNNKNSNFQSEMFLPKTSTPEKNNKTMKENIESDMTIGTAMTSTPARNNRTMNLNLESDMTIGTAMTLTPAINNKTRNFNFDTKMALSLTPEIINKTMKTEMTVGTTMFSTPAINNKTIKLNHQSNRTPGIPMTSTPAIKNHYPEIPRFELTSTPSGNKKSIRSNLNSELLTFSPPPHLVQLRKSRSTFITPKKYSPHYKLKNSKKLRLLKNIPKTPNCTITSNIQNTPKASQKLKNKIYSEEMNPSSEPFSSYGIYYDEDWLNDQQIHLTKWINVLVQPNIENDSNEPSKIDIAAVWKKSCTKGMGTPAKSKEQVTEKWYNSPARFGSVHKAAARLYRNPSIKEPLVKLAQAIERGILSIRSDIKLCVDISVKAQVINILLSYNPLWLRLGLETVFNETAPFKTNGDHMSIRCWLERLLIPSDKSKNPPGTNVYLPNYQALSNKVFLKRWLSLVLLLDKAKKSRMFSHDPCLFQPGAIVRSSREVLCKIASLVLAGMGDIVKHMRTYGYVVTHEQTYVDEIYYGVNNIRQDLRDGIRLVRIVELVLGNYSLTSKLRAPAGSLLQKIHNVQVALDALSAAGFELQGPPIAARDIVNGHREKTLSLIWQIVYRLQGPRFEKSAKIIQKWWRKVVLSLKKQKGTIFYTQECAALKIQYVWRRFIKTKHLQNQLEEKQNNAALLIQRAWKKYILLKKQEELIYLQETAAIKIQCCWRSYYKNKVKHEKLLYLRECSAIKIQQWWRNCLKLKREKELFILSNSAALVIQRAWKNYLIIKANKLIIHKRESAAILIQYSWRRFICIKKKEELLNKSACIIQRAWKLYLKIKEKRLEEYTRESAAITIQYFWRRYIHLKKREELLNKSACIIQRAWKLYLKIKEKRLEEYTRESAAITIQYFWRRYIHLKKREELLNRSASIIQRAWKLYLKIKEKRLEEYTRESAAITIQYFWRRYIHLKKREELLNKSASIIQRNWKIYLKIKEKRLEEYIRESAAITIQYFWRRYLQIKRRNNSALIIQQCWKKYIKIKKEKEENFQRESSALLIQYVWKKYIKIKKQKDWERANSATLLIQKSWRSYIKIKKEKQMKLNKLNTAANAIQNAWRDYNTKKKHKELRKKQKIAACTILQYWKKYLIVKKKKLLAHKKESAAIKIQYFWRRYIKNKQIEIELSKQRTISLNELRRQTCLPQQLISNKQESVRDKFFKAVKKLENKNSSLGWQINAMICIDTLTSLIPLVCEQLAGRPHTLNLIKDILRNSNRSLPEITISEHATNIFLTLCKHPASSSAIFDQDDLIDLLLQVLTRSCKGKHNQLFLNAATVLWLMAHHKGPRIFTQTHKNSLTRLIDLENHYYNVQKRQQPSLGKVIQLLPNEKHQWHIGKTILPKTFQCPLYAIKQILFLL